MKICSLSWIKKNLKKRITPNMKAKSVLTDEIFDLYSEYLADPRQHKINGGIGIYLDKLGKPFVNPVVGKVASLLDYSNFNYLPISGNPVFLEESAKWVLGSSLYNHYKNKLAKQGTTGGTNGLFVWGNLMKLDNKNPRIILGLPTWENHTKIFNYLGFKIITYPHLNTNNKFNIEALKCTVRQHPGCYVLLQGLTHNPTGVGPTRKEWLYISRLIRETKSYVCFDFAYIGFGGTIKNDCFPLRHFLKENIPMAMVISYSKNMSLYQHRTGCLIIPCSTKDLGSIELKLKYLFRVINSSPPAFGEMIVKSILQNKGYKKQWLVSLTGIRKDLHDRRKLFDNYSNRRFHYVTDQNGLFSLLNIKKEMISRLKKDYGVYLLSNSRINFGGISLSDIPKLARTVLLIE